MKALSSHPRLSLAAVVLILFSPLLWDLGRKFTRTGIYRPNCRGTVIDTSRTLAGMADAVDCSGSRKQRRQRRRSDRTYDHRGHYVAKIADESGETFEVSISGSDYDHARPGHYIICRGARRDLYDSKQAAAASKRTRP